MDSVLEYRTTSSDDKRTFDLPKTINWGHVLRLAAFGFLIVLLVICGYTQS